MVFDTSLNYEIADAVGVANDICHHASEDTKLGSPKRISPPKTIRQRAY